MNLVDGGAFHEALAQGLATPADHNWERALSEARVKFDEGVRAANLLEVEQFRIESHWQLVEAMALLYKQHYEMEQYTVLQPECSFDVALPNSHHNCIFVHHYEVARHSDPLGVVEKWGPPDPQAILEKRVIPAHDPFEPDEICSCWQPHRVVGKTDAIIMWQARPWLMEHKTTAISGDQFWDGWELDVQPTTYMWGVWKATGLRPRGFVLDAIYKPSQRQVNSWNEKRKYGPPKNIVDYLNYERRAFLRSEEDLVRVESQYLALMREWERRVLEGDFPMANWNAGQACKLYNRKCDFWTACLSHDDPVEFAALQARAPDYVADKLVQLLPTREEVSRE
jgi:hypothetical protein